MLSEHGLGKEVLYQSDSPRLSAPQINGVWPAWRHRPSPNLAFTTITVGDLMKGRSAEFTSLMDALRAEIASTKACGALRQLIMNAQKFDGETIHEF